MYWTLTDLETRFGPDLDLGDRLLSKAEAAEIAGAKTVGTVSRWSAGRGFPIPWLVHGRTVRWKRADVLAWRKRQGEKHAV